MHVFFNLMSLIKQLYTKTIAKFTINFILRIFKFMS